VILNRRDDATERLLDFAENVKGDVRSTEKRFKNGVQEQFRKDYSFFVRGVDEFILWILKKVSSFKPIEVIGST
jgi:5-methyltetrahydrofolate--homocysteine methyltransferase